MGADISYLSSVGEEWEIQLLRVEMRTEKAGPSLTPPVILITSYVNLL